MLDDAAAAHRLLEAGRLLALAVIPLMHSGPGRPPLDDDPQTVLAHPRRRRVFELIEERPGIPGIEIRHVLGVGGGTVDNHIDRLLRAGLIESRASGKFLRFFPAGTAPRQDDPALLPETTKNVARALLRRPGRASIDLAQELQLSQRRVSEHLAVLVKADLARAVQDGRRVTHEPTGRLKQAAEEW